MSNNALKLGYTYFKKCFFLCVICDNPTKNYKFLTIVLQDNTFATKLLIVQNNK